MGKQGLLSAAGFERRGFGSSLVFNQSWEDPETDRWALAIQPDDTLVTIASAGDNALAITLTEPRKVIAIDQNPAQIHLLRLKIVAAQCLDYPDFWHLFSLDPAPFSHSLYHHKLRPHLEPDTRAFWDANMGLFRAGLGRAGRFGRTLWLLRTYLRLLCGRRALEDFFLCESPIQQAVFYRERIHRRWWNPLAKPLVGFWPALLLFGAHPCQARRVSGRRFADRLAGSIARVLTTLAARENYFWQQAFLGRYLNPPAYLRRENFAQLKSVVSRIETRIGKVQDWIGSLLPATVTCFNLGDALDWLSAEEMVEFWALLRRVAAPEARVLFRSIDSSFTLPEPVTIDWKDQSQIAWTLNERTGVYAGVYLYKLRDN